jgi:hypothetical protein
MPNPYMQEEIVDLSPVTNAVDSVRRAVLAQEYPEAVEVKNLDEIRLSLRKELKAVVDAVKSIDIPEAPKKVEVSNFPSSEKHPDSVKVNNLGELSTHLERLLTAVSGLNMAPVVNVPAPIVNIAPSEAPVVNIPQSLPPIVDLDLSALLSALKPLGLLSRDPNKPITVRMSDGRSFIDAIASVLKDNGERLATVVSTSYGLTKDEYKAAAREMDTTLRNGMSIPYHNSQVIDEADPDDVTITYKLNGTTVATKRIQVVGTTTTITVS